MTQGKSEITYSLGSKKNEGGTCKTSRKTGNHAWPLVLLLQLHTLTQQVQLHCFVSECLSYRIMQFNRWEKKNILRKNNKATINLWDMILYSSSLPLSSLYFVLIIIFPSLRHRLGISCASSMPQHHLEPELLNLAPPCSAPNATS